MNEFVQKYKAAYSAEQRYRDAPRKGWVDPKGKKNKANQTIEVPRQEVMELARGLVSAQYGNYHRLYQNMALSDFLSQLASNEPDAITCKKCFCTYLPKWLNGRCPCCAADATATEKMNEFLEE